MVNRKPTGGPTGRPRNTPAPAEIELERAEDGADETLEDRELRTIAKIQGVLDTSGGNAPHFSVGVFQVIDQPGGRAPRQPWIFNCTIDDLNTLREKLRDEWGAGRYRCRVARNLVPFAQYDMEIALPPRRPGAPQSSPAPGTDSQQTAAPAMNPPAWLDAILARMDRSDKMQEMLFTRLMAQPATGAGGLGAVKETVEALVAINGLVPKAEPNIGVEMFNKGFELAKTILGESGRDGGGGISELVRDALNSPTVAAIAGKLMPAAGQPNPRGPGGQVGPPAIARPPIPAPAPGGGPGDALKPTIDFLCAKAREGADPALLSDWVMDAIAKVPGAFDLLNSQVDKLGALERMFPQIGPYRPWFAALIANLIEPEQDDGEGSPAAPANDGAADGLRVQP